MNSLNQGLEKIINVASLHLSDDKFSKFKQELIKINQLNDNAAAKLKHVASVLGTYIGKEVEHEWQSEILEEYTRLTKKIFNK